jgi:hypothetical protein
MFQDVFLTVVAAYVLFKILGEFSDRKQRNAPPYQAPYEPPRNNNNNTNQNKDIEGEYVDYEEIKS